MTQIETIIVEIERRMEKNQQDATESGAGAFYEDRQLLSFINSLPAEHTSEDVEEAANIYANKQGLELKPFAIKFFKSGADWQKEQMMKNCLYDTEVMLHTKQNNTEYLTLANDKLPHIPVSFGIDVGDKVKVIIVKEDEQ